MWKISSVWGSVSEGMKIVVEEVSTAIFVYTLTWFLPPPLGGSS